MKLLAALFGGAFLIFVVFAIVIFVPWFTFWAINVLFGIKIVLTFKTWLACMVLWVLWATS